MVRKDRTTAANREFWDDVAAAAREVESWPSWKKGRSTQGGSVTMESGQLYIWSDQLFERIYTPAKKYLPRRNSYQVPFDHCVAYEKGMVVCLESATGYALTKIAGVDREELLVILDTVLFKPKPPALCASRKEAGE